MTAVTDTPAWIAEITMAELEKDPYPFYERLRREAPVAFVPALGLHIASTRRPAGRSAHRATSGTA